MEAQWLTRPNCQTVSRTLHNITSGLSEQFHKLLFLYRIGIRYNFETIPLLNIVTYTYNNTNNYVPFQKIQN